MESTSVSRLRGLAAPLRLARARIAARPGRGLLAALGVAAAVAMLAATASGGRIASERALDRAIDRLPAGQRALTVTHAGPVENYAAANSRARAALHGLAPGEPAASVLYRTLRLDHGIVLLGAVDDIGRYVRLTGGRLPRSCTPERCEVLQVDGSPLDETATEGARFVTVGTAVLRSALPFGSTANLGEAAGSRKPPPTLLARRRLGDGADARTDDVLQDLQLERAAAVGHPQLGDRRAARPRGAHAVRAGNGRYELGAVRAGSGAGRGPRLGPGRRPADAAGRRRGRGAASGLHAAGRRRPAPGLGGRAAPPGAARCPSVAAAGVLVGRFRVGRAGRGRAGRGRGSHGRGVRGRRGRDRRLGPAPPLGAGHRRSRRPDRLLGGGHGAAGGCAAGAVRSAARPRRRSGGAGSTGRARPRPRPRRHERGRPGRPLRSTAARATAARGAGGRHRRRPPAGVGDAQHRAAGSPRADVPPAGGTVAGPRPRPGGDHRRVPGGGVRTRHPGVVVSGNARGRSTRRGRLRRARGRDRPRGSGVGAAAGCRAALRVALAPRQPAGAARASAAGIDRGRRRVERVDPGARRAGRRPGVAAPVGRRLPAIRNRRTPRAGAADRDGRCGHARGAGVAPGHSARRARDARADRRGRRRLGRLGADRARLRREVGAPRHGSPGRPPGRRRARAGRGRRACRTASGRGGRGVHLRRRHPRAG